MITLYIIGVSIFLGYTIYTIAKNGISSSFSDTFYAMGNKGWLFQAVLVSLTFLLMPVILELSEGFKWQPIAFFTIAPIAFVGLTPLFKMKGSIEAKVHVYAALISAINSIAFILLTMHLNNIILYAFIGVILIMCIGYILNNFKNIIWWLEYICFISLLFTLGLLLYEASTK